MKKCLFFIAIVFFMINVFAVTTSSGQLKGYIDDSMCASSKTPYCTPATRVNCAQKCIKSGSKAVLVVGKKIYKISNQSFVLKFAGKNVTVEGKITNDSIEVTKVTEEKA
jgi:hypothetical protein